MHSGKLVFSQLTEHLPMHTFRRYVERYQGNRHIKSFSCLDQFLCMAFGNYLPPPYTIFGKGEENSSRNEAKTFWLRLRKVEMAAWIRA